MILALVQEHRVQPLIQTPYIESNGEISADGRWLAFESNSSSRSRDSRAPFANVDGGLWQVSTAGGTRPLWARSGQELFYRSPTGAVVGVQVDEWGNVGGRHSNEALRGQLLRPVRQCRSDVRLCRPMADPF